jgi:hypothetical protein
VLDEAEADDEAEAKAVDDEVEEDAEAEADAQEPEPLPLSPELEAEPSLPLLPLPLCSPLRGSYLQVLSMRGRLSQEDCQPLGGCRSGYVGRVPDGSVAGLSGQWEHGTSPGRGVWGWGQTN